MKVFVTGAAGFRFLTGGKVVSTDYLMSFRKSVSRRAADDTAILRGKNLGTGVGVGEVYVDQ